VSCNVPLALFFYNWFKVVNKNVALLMVFFDLVVTAIASVSLLADFAPLVFLGGGHYLSAFTAQQLQAAAYISVPLFEHGFDISLVFFGFDCLAMAYLILWSTLLSPTHRGAAGDRRLGVTHQQFRALSRARVTSPDLPLFHGYRDRRRSAVPVALGALLRC
jgi:hypothetical protein